MLQPTVELIAPSEAKRGQPVEIVLRVRNDGAKAVDFELSGRPVGFDIAIETDDGTEVWRRLDGEAVASALMLVTLQPGEARDFTERWLQQDRAGDPVTPGRYVVRGILPMGRRRLVTAPHDLLIRP